MDGMHGLTLQGGGRRPTRTGFHFVRELERVDVERIAEGEVGAHKGGQVLEKLRYNHHLLAKLIASGRSLVECSRVTGFAPGTCAVLKNDPAFAELVEHYKATLDEVFVDVHRQMAGLAMDAIGELRERLDAEPEKFSKRELLDLFEKLADRSIPTAKGGPSPLAGSPQGGSPVAVQINFVPAERYVDGVVVDLEKL